MYKLNLKNLILFYFSIIPFRILEDTLFNKNPTNKNAN